MEKIISRTREVLMLRSISIVLIITLIGILGYLLVGKRVVENKVAILQVDLENLEQKTASTTHELVDIFAMIQKIQENSASTQNYTYNELAKIGDVQVKLKELTGTVDTLEKLSKTDVELLQKYSKVYFLNEHFVPLSLSQIQPEYTYEQKEKLIHSNISPFLQTMITSAANGGIALRVISAYRSFNEQVGLKSGYKVTYGEGANTFSADQGYSEHQLGSTVDFTTEELGAKYDKFDETFAYEWLLQNAYKFGFVLSYAENNQYYVYEPWHWRFVGVKLATELRLRGLNFYDMDQRTIDEYLVNIFD